jgi:pimeloyl-CoA dehydrogenase small subunit
MAGLDPAIHVLPQKRDVDARVIGAKQASSPRPGMTKELNQPKKVENMDFDLSEEQRLLKESVDGLLNDSYDFDQRKKYMKEKGGWSKAVWSRLAEQGLLGLPFAEDDGGFGAGAVETMIVMEALGKALMLEPYLPTVVIAGGFLRHGGSAAQKAEHIAGIIDGSKTFAFAQLEKNSRYDLGDVSTSAKKKNGGWVIDGEKFVVVNGENADMLLVTARTKGGRHDKTGIGVFLVPANAKGITKKGYPTQDGLHAADISFTGVEVGADAAIGDSENALPLIERVVDEARTAMCAEAVGAMDESLKTTVEYLKTRKQFGVAIGSFQTLQHRAADMFVGVEQARSMSMFATMAVDFEDPKERATAVAAAKVQVGKSLKFVGQQSIQLHGGIGMTQEAKIGHYFKRLTMIENSFGDTDYHLRRVTESGGLV